MVNGLRLTCVAFLRTLLCNPVLQRSDLLAVLLLAGVLLLGRQVELLLHAVGGQRALVLEGTRGDVVLGSALGAEADVDGLDVGRGVPLAGQDVGLRDAVLGRLHGGVEDAQAVQLDGVALGDEVRHAADHLGQHALDDVASVD